MQYRINSVQGPPTELISNNSFPAPRYAQAFLNLCTQKRLCVVYWIESRKTERSKWEKPTNIQILQDWLSYVASNNHWMSFEIDSKQITITYELEIRPLELTYIVEGIQSFSDQITINITS